MKKNLLSAITASLVLIIVAVLAILVCSAAPKSEDQAVSSQVVQEVEDTSAELPDGDAADAAGAGDLSAEQAAGTVEETVAEVTEVTAGAETAAAMEDAEVDYTVYEGGVLDTSEAFTERDLQQNPSLDDAVTYTVTSDSDIHITEEGTYVLTGTASNTTIYVEADSAAKIQLVLDGLSVANTDFPCIYVTGGDKVWITTVSDSALCVTGEFRSDEETNTDGVIFSRSDVVLNGTAVLTVNSSENGVVSKDDLKITGGTYIIQAASKAIEANDSIRISGGTLELTAGTDGLHAENDDDDALGYVYICDGTISIKAGDDGIHGTSVVQIDSGDISISAAEGIEGTCIQINDGTVSITSTDDGINAANKSAAYTTGLEINGGTITVDMGQGDTDAIDSNGNLTVNGGTIDITGYSAFDCDGAVEYNGGTILFNGQQLDSIPNQGGMMGGGHGQGGGRSGMDGESRQGMMNGEFAQDGESAGAGWE